MKWIIIILSLICIWIFGQFIFQLIDVFEGTGSFAWLSCLVIIEYCIIYFILLLDRYERAKNMVDIDFEYEELMKQERESEKE